MRNHSKSDQFYVCRDIDDGDVRACNLRISPFFDTLEEAIRAKRNCKFPNLGICKTVPDRPEEIDADFQRFLQQAIGEQR